MSSARSRSTVRVRTALTAVCAALMLAVGLADATPAAAATPATPAFPKSIDPYPRYETESGCDPTAKPGAVALANLLVATYGKISTNVSRPCTASNSGHEEGRSVDWMTNARNPGQYATAQSFLNWLLATDQHGNQHAMARRLGVQYVIWNDHKFYLWNTKAGWTDYNKCTSDPALADVSKDNYCHRNHVHISMSWAGANQQTSWWPHQYTAWAGLGGNIVGKPAAAAQSYGVMDVVARGVDRGLYQRSFKHGWGEWESLGGQSDTDPALVSWAPGRRDLFVRGTDAALWHRAYSNGKWSQWTSLGGTLTSSPTAASTASGRLDVMVRGADNALWHRSLVNGVWSGWTYRGGVLTSSASLTAEADGDLHVAVAGADRAVWTQSVSKGAWSGWQHLGGTTRNDPAIVSPRVGVLEVGVLGTDGQLWRRGSANGWGAWSAVPGGATSSPAMSSWGDGRIDAFARGPVGELRHTWAQTR